MPANEPGFDEDMTSQDLSGADIDQFEDLMSNYLDSMSELEVGQLTTATVIEIRKDYVLIDVGDKAEGIVEAREFLDFRGNMTINAGDTVEVVIQSRDSDSGHVIASYRKAKQRVEWNHLLEAFEKGYTVHGHVVRALKNGVLVDAGVPCFLPVSQLDTTRVENLETYVGQDIEAYVIDVDKQRRRGVLSRRKLLVEDQKRKREEALNNLEVGATVSGKVKSVLDFGVFVDLGGVDGLVPREEVAWEKHVNIPEILKPGSSYKLKVVSVDKERERVTLSRRQLKPDPWQKIEQDYPKELEVNGTVSNLTNNCAYVVLADGIEGRIHRNNLSWSPSVKKPSDVLQKGQTVKSLVLDYDFEKRLLELGIKQMSVDPWADIEQRYPENSRHHVKVVEIVPFGTFVQLDENTKGLIHVSDMSHDRNFKDPKKLLKVGDEVDAVVLKIDLEARRINFGIKQLEEDPFATYIKANPQGSLVTGKVKSITNFGAFIELAPLVEGLLHISQWGKEKIEDLNSVLKPGDEVQVKIIKVERDIKKLSLSRRAVLQDEERQVVDQYKKNVSEATTSLGSLLKGIKID